MCLNPISIRNPTKRIATEGGHLLQMQVSCGHCAECVQSKRNEWFVRTKFEVERTLAQCGYVYFDSLTYDDAHLPKLSHYCDIEKYGIGDFSCFDRNHFKAFLKRLRRRLAYHYKVDSNAFRYFITSEYGTDERYTHRPHYHILFFVTCGLSPLTFSRCVSECWPYGRTDGLPYKPSTYVMTHVYSNSNNTSFRCVESVCMYVSKYINKDSKFAQKLQNRKDYLRAAVTQYNALNNSFITDDDEQYICDLCRNIDMFHRQSQGFGASYLDDMTPEKWMFVDDNKVVLKDSKKIVSTYNLPMYYRRKLFYTLKKHSDGKRYWELTELGKKHMVSTKLAQVDKLALHYMDSVNNCTDEYFKQKIYHCLDGRSLEDYAVYELLYKGRHRHKDSINYNTNLQNEKLNNEESNLYDWLLCLSNSATPYLVDSRSSVAVDEGNLRQPISSAEKLKELEFEFARLGHPFAPISNTRGCSYNNYVKLYTFNEDSCPEFRLFDHLGVLLRLIETPKNENKQMTFTFLEDIKAKYKTFFNKKL